MAYERMMDLMADILQRDVDASLTLDADGGVSPLDVARLVIAAEKAFHVCIMDECAAQWRTMADACGYVQGLLDAGEDGQSVKSDAEREAWYYQ